MPEVDPGTMLHLVWNTLQQQLIAENLQLYSSLKKEAPIW